MFTDLFIYFLIISLMIRGALRGLGASILDPISVIIATGGAYFLLKNTHNIPISLALGLLGPFFLYRFLKNLFIVDNKPTLSSRILGALITLAWGLIFLLPIIYLLTFLPVIHPALKPITKDIKASVIIASLSKEFDKYIFHKSNASKTQLPLTPKPTSSTKTIAGSPVLATDTSNPLSKDDFLKDPNNNENNPHQIDSLQEFLSDPRIEDVRSDPQIKSAIEEKNYAVLMSNPKIMKLMQDPEFIKRMMQELKKKQESGDIPTNQ